MLSLIVRCQEIPFKWLLSSKFFPRPLLWRLRAFDARRWEICFHAFIPPFVKSLICPCFWNSSQRANHYPKEDLESCFKNMFKYMIDFCVSFVWNKCLTQGWPWLAKRMHYINLICPQSVPNLSKYMLISYKHFINTGLVQGEGLM